MRPLIIRIILISLLLSPVSVFSKSSEKMIIKDAWIRMLPAVATTTGMFFSLTNDSRVVHKLVQAESSIAKEVEIHTHLKEDGMFRMREVEEILLPAKATKKFEPGGDHIMLIGLKRPLKEGESLEVKLTFADGSSKVIHPVVRR